jgi:putative ABC transport system permease protein
MRTLIDELRAAASALARAPAFTALAVGVLALGLGAVIFMYGVADTMMLKPAPYPAADRLYNVALFSPRGDQYSDVMAPLDYRQLREAQTQFEAIGSIYVGTVYLTGDGQAERYSGGFADGFIFDVVGVAPILGRAIEPRDTSEGAAPVVVLSYELWTERFGADPGAIGRVVRVSGRSSEIVGVMPEGYSFPSSARLWLANQQDPTRFKRRDAALVSVYGRLRADGNLDVAHREFAPIAARIAADDPQKVFDSRFEVMPLSYSFRKNDVQLVWMLLIAVGFVLLVACANVSNLLLARSAYRVRETTVRSALGASRSRLIAHVLAESVLISTLATLVGLLLASIALDGFRAVASRLWLDSPSWWTFEIDARVALVAVAAAFASTLVAGLPAAIRASRPSLDALLRDGGRTGTSLAIGRIASGLVVFEVALACVVLGSAALMTKAVLNATNHDIGVRTDDIMTARVGLALGPENEEQIRFWQALLRHIEEQPGVDSAAIAGSLPAHRSDQAPTSIEGRDYGDASTRPVLDRVIVSPSFFDTFRISAAQGRVFDGRDRLDTMPVAVINETMAREFWPGESPLGARVRFEAEGNPKWYTVVGVVQDVLQNSAAARARAQNDADRFDPTFYISFTQRPDRFMSIAVRGSGDPRSLASAVRKALAQTDPDMALYYERTLDEAIVVATAIYRMIGTIFVVFATVALLLAAAGLYGVLSFHVGQRTREIGVRLALGADHRRILRLIARTSGTQVLIGIVVGMIALPFVGRGFGNLLQEQNPYDPVIYGLVLTLMAVVAIVATLLPTVRALRVDPAVALRYE